MERKARDSCGIQRVCGDPAGACDEEAPWPPRGMREPAAQINLQEKQSTTMSLYNPITDLNSELIGVSA
ncbi:hypothetical protein [Heyndrickxia acidicola]|uniref:Uncharacterized protein n=1 Tax=Heyndrickxia acidicola TaxID=209389 RepID=A0ABU6MEY1_9BACI|nr:hypothetical protein [Heyndrickxia acidicola]MED1203060.1 hypothetical protein [Heyndrickxia acidicola]